MGEKVKKALVDRGLGKFISRTLLVFFIATGFFAIGKLSEEGWLDITMLYLGIQKFADSAERVVEKWRTKRRKDDDVEQDPGISP